jgi:hypothetical protein
MSKGEKLFKVGDLVDVKNRGDLTHYGRVKALHDNKALVHFRMPRQPKNGCCDRCHSPGLLSEDFGTGEIVCMRSGCGHSHGFNQRDEKISLNLLVNITTKRHSEDKSKFRTRLAALLREGVKSELITSDVASQMLGLV